MLAYLIAIPFLVALADRMRGGLLADHGIRLSKVPTLFHAWTIALACGHGFDWIGLGLVLALSVGEAIGWGRPLGSALTGVLQNGPDAQPESYERWIGHGLANHPWWSLAVRGVIWALPALPLAYYDATLLNLLWIMPFTIVAAPFIARHTEAYRAAHLHAIMDGAWPAQEIYRGFLVGLLCVLVTLL